MISLRELMFAAPAVLAAQAMLGRAVGGSQARNAAAYDDHVEIVRFAHALPISGSACRP